MTNSTVHLQSVEEVLLAASKHWWKRRNDIPVTSWNGTACILWGGTIKSNGYGRLSSHGKVYSAHRFVYEKTRGPIPDGLTLDHLCRNKLCVNPDHLEPVTLRVNILRSNGFAAKNAAKSHCAHGHELSGRNLILRARNGRTERNCRKCGLDVMARERARKKQSQLAVQNTTADLTTNNRTGAM